MLLDKNNVEDIYPLSKNKEALLYYYLRYPNSDLYYEFTELSIDGDIDTDIFFKAVYEIIRTHSVLRSFFVWEQIKKAIQVVNKRTIPDIVCHDLSNFAGDLLNQKFDEYVNIKRHEKFDLRKVPFKIRLIILSKERYKLLIFHHHILFDGWSSSIIIRDLVKFYDVLKHKKQICINKPYDYKEYLQYASKLPVESALVYWQRYLHGTQSQLRDNKFQNKIFMVKTAKFNYSTEIMQNVKLFLKQHKVTFASIVYFSWAIILYFLKCTSDILFGTTVSGRNVNLSVIENIVGLFINTIPLRVILDEKKTTLELLLEIQENLAIRSQYENTSVIEIQNCVSSSNHILFDSIVVIENYPFSKDELSNSDFRITDVKFDLPKYSHYSLNLLVSNFESYEVSLTYNSEEYSEQDIVAINNSIMYIFEFIVNYPNKALFQLELKSLNHLTEDKDLLGGLLNSSEIEFDLN